MNDVNAGEPVEAGPSNAAPQVAETGAVEESTVVSSSESKSTMNAIQVTDPKHEEEVNTPASTKAANVQSRKSAIKTEGNKAIARSTVCSPICFVMALKWRLN